MKIQSKILMVAGTVFLAAATGHVVQNGGSLTAHAPVSAASSGSVALQPTAITMVAARSDRPRALPSLPEARNRFPDAPVELASRLPDRGPWLPAGPAEAPAAAHGQTCAMALSIEAAPAAMLSVVLDAPCRAGERVVIRHEGLAVTARTNAAGVMRTAIPAFATDAAVTIAFAGGATVSDRASVPDLADFERVGVQWQGKDAFQLHALEFGAEYGQPGHVSSIDPRNPGHGARATGGFLSILGDDAVTHPMLAEVYSYPVARATRAGVVRLHLEAAVTAESCGREMLAETLDFRGGEALQRVDLSLAMPGCEAQGQYLMLKNLLRDLKIARN